MAPIDSVHKLHPEEHPSFLNWLRAGASAEPATACPTVPAGCFLAQHRLVEAVGVPCPEAMLPWVSFGKSLSPLQQCHWWRHRGQGRSQFRGEQMSTCSRAGGVQCDPLAFEGRRVSLRGGSGLRARCRACCARAERGGAQLGGAAAIAGRLSLLPTRGLHP